MKKAAVIYWSHTGNTEKVAKSIHAGLLKGGMEVDIFKVSEAADVDFYDYDLVCFGVPSYNWHVPKPADDYLKSKFLQYKKAGRILPSAPKIAGKNALVFCTYSGPHTGIREATPTVLYIGQFFEHFGFTIADEWCILAEFVGDEANNLLGRMGNIKGLPTESDLARITDSARNLAMRL